MEKSPTPTIAEITVPVAMVRFANRRTGTSGSSTRSSFMKKRANAIAATANATGIATVWEWSPIQDTASTSETSPIVSAIDPAMSKRAGRPGWM